MNKRIICMLLAVLMVFAMTACGAKEEAKAKEITVVATGSFFPISYTDDKGELTGFEVEALKEVAKRAGYEIKWELSDDYTAMFGGVDSGLYDTIVGQISYTEQRAETYAFTDKYAANRIRMCVREDDPAESVDDLQGRIVHIQFGTTLHTFFEEYNAGRPADQQINCIEAAGSPYEELEVGHTDAFPITELSFDSVMEKGEYKFKLIGDAIIVDYQAWPFAKDADPEMLAAFNAAIKEMQEDGTMAALSEQFYGRDVTQVSAG